MTLIARMSRLFKADFHAVLDQVEEPQMLLKHAIREMENELHAAERRLRETLAERDTLSTREEAMQAALREMDEELDLCFEDDKSDLARDIIKRKLQTQRAVKRVAARLEAVEKVSQESRKQLAQNRLSLDSAQQKAELFTGGDLRGEHSTTFAGGGVCDTGEFAVTDNDIEVALLREKKRRARS